MTYAYPIQQSLPVTTLVTEQSRQKLIKAIISYREGAYSVTEPTQQMLLNQFAQGRLTIDEVVYYLEMNASATPASH